MNKIFIVLLCLIGQVLSQCWQGSYGRGVGKVISSCKNDQDKDGALCYPKCIEGYRGVGPVCWENCPSGFTDIGLFCTRPAHIYGKGCCCTIFTKSCCNSCQSGYKDDGCTCRRDVVFLTKKSYGRGVGSPLGCASDEEYSNGLCYPSCRPGYNGIGPVCWAKSCYGAYNYGCAALCTTDSNQCKSVTQDIVQNSVKLGIDIATTISTLGANPNYAGLISNTAGFTASLINEVCGYPNILATHCWKKLNIYTSSLFNCRGSNPVDCGLFCASSQVMCAKVYVTITSNIAGLVSTFNAITNPNKAKDVEKAKSFLDKYPQNKLVKLLKDAKAVYDSEVVQDLKLFYSAFSQVVGIFMGISSVEMC